jgi:hypothetical protein
MDDKISILDASIDTFFLRAGLASRDRLDCYAFIRDIYPGQPITPASCQGYCSLTVFVGDILVVQFRPSVYKLDLQIAQAAREIYGPFAPDTKYIGTLPSSGLLAYTMNRVEGISFKDFRSANPTAYRSTEHRRRLCKGFAGFLAKAWHNSGNKSIPLGMIGQSLVARLKALVTDLPLRFQSTARNILRQLHRIEALPWVLTHGDIIAANIMVDLSSCHLLGFVDWAEAERLPFGVCFYGLEEILGEMTPSGFRYHPDSEDVRNLFWEELKTQIPELQQTHLLDAVKLARDLGVLLWHGIAFDNGAIDRVVKEGRDVEEIHRLDAFLDLQSEQQWDILQDPINKESPIPFPISITPSLVPFQRDAQRKHISAE